jgi:putative ABC transport system ATP-binding protein
MALLSPSRIDLINVTQSFSLNNETVELFRDINLSVIQGKSYAITGPSGAGKSSLLMLMSGLETPTEGRVTPIPRENMGFIFQQFHLLPELTALNNVALPLKLRGDKQAVQKATQWLEKVGLAKRLYHKPAQLSGGEQQRVAIARALIFGPKFIFADEPTGNLDEKSAENIADLLFSSCEESGASLVIVTHSSDLAARAETIFSLNAGRCTHVHA